MTTYEELRIRIADLSRPKSSDEREVHWITNSQVVGISRTYENRLEIFLAGRKLVPTTRSVAGAIEHGPWWREGDTAPSFEANRLLLPAVAHFDQVAAFMCTELLQNGADEDMSSAFAKTEALIGLVLERLWLSNAALLGLAGELLVVEALCRQAANENVAKVVQGWEGWQRSLRDVTLGAVGVEVKSTRGASSTHQIQGMHQVEPQDGESETYTESSLVLVSVGLKEVARHENSFTVPMLVDRIRKRLSDAGRDDGIDIFLARVREYGSESGFGYDHLTMSHDVAFGIPFETTFVRAYDMADKNISVIRRVDVAGHRHVDARSITFNIELPVSVTGDLNPIVGINQAASAILDMSGVM